MEYFVKTENDADESKRILYTPSFFARSSLIHLQEVGKLSALKQHSSERNGLKSYLFFIVQKGSGELFYKDNLYYLNKGSCVFIDCNTHYEHRTNNALWTLLWIHFNGESLGKIYQKYVERGGTPVFYPNDINPFYIVWNLVYNLSSTTDYIRDMRINEALNNLLTLLMQETCISSVEKDQSYHLNDGLDGVHQYLDLHFRDELLLDDISKKFYISKYHLARSFKEKYGISINAYVNVLRITNAKHLLRFSNKSIAIVSHECGIEDGNYFSRLFKKIEGISPTEYRRMWSEKVTVDD